MISFNKNSIFNLTPINPADVQKDIAGFLIQNEVVLAAFKTIRDRLVFTNYRIISIDVQGITGKRKSYSTLPYSKIVYFTVQTPGFLEIVPDSELFISFANGYEAKYEFKGNVDISAITRCISFFALR